ncbi:pseudouridine synthase [Lyngbya confervoides]|uniref:Pseudouridine synthase n=1 Tax=Lyngbya confervoides BDU141951 TaxID=1574623 RepID=A0ABD4T5C6_9CYAN|nr:pseudouridine synthase [Lyngbya confervoides]MCM1983859.1 rRNA pseudouridine synthase [Lyngbya confervoides BDU141951]
MAERLQKILAHWGIASRRQAEQMILQGQVRLNGVTATLGQCADPQTDHIEVEGRSLTAKAKPQKYYILLNKPKGVLSTCHDPQGRPTVLSLLPRSLQNSQGLHPVGRLDQDTTGLLLLTNEGQLTFQLTHPRHHISKTYRVWLSGQPDPGKIKQWRSGIDLDGQRTLPAEVQVLTPVPDPPLSLPPFPKPHFCLQIRLWEGRNRQIRRVAAQLGYGVLHLHRSHIGTLSLEDWPQDRSSQHKIWRYLTPTELKDLTRRHSKEE